MKTIVYGDGMAGCKPCVATIGFFDGVHRGHRHLIGEVTARAHEMGLESVVVTFDRHPRQVVATDFRPRLLSAMEEKLVLLEKSGVDSCVVLPFDKDMASMSAREFMAEILSRRLNVKVLYTGYDHRFGHNRSEGFADYVEYGRQMAMEVLRGEPYLLDGVNVSSSVVRSLLEAGEVRLASKCLGYSYTLLGHVVAGEHVGTGIGFPTANVKVDDDLKLIPANGVYAVKVRVAGCAEEMTAMLNIGIRPTFEGKGKTIEAHILNFSGDIYGKQIAVSFFDKIRDERKFRSPAELAAQLEADAREAERRLKVED